MADHANDVMTKLRSDNARPRSRHAGGHGGVEPGGGGRSGDCERTPWRRMAASIVGGFIADQRDDRWQDKQISHAVTLARAIIAEVERTQPEEKRRKLTKRDDDRPDHHHGQ